MNINTHQSDSPYIEAGVLASMMLGPTYIPMIRAIILSPSYFLDTNHQVIFRAICDCWDNNGDEDTMLVQVRQVLDSSGMLDSVGGVEYLMKVVESTPSAASWEYFSKKMREQHSKRELQRCAHEILSLASSSDSSDVAIEKAQGIMRRILVEDMSCGGVVSLEGLADIADSFVMEDFIPTGLQSIDEAIKGVKACEVIIIAARPAMGKTALAMDFAINMVKDDTPVAFFSLEMRALELKQRIVCNQTRTNADAYLNGYIHIDKKEQIKKELNELAKKPLYIDASARLTPNTFHAKIIQYKAKYGIRVAIIDYLTLMQTDAKTNSMYEKFTEIVNEIKRIAKDENIAVILVCQLNRGPESRTDKRPNMGDIRDSGAIEQNADIIMMIYREDFYSFENTGEAEIIIGKARRGAPQIRRLRFHGEYTKFEDV